ncbi:MAG: hypothetical protein HFJ45_06975 [Clostridia bacterium]|nr:hypothetical protein [Clostridia bacterium]
MKTQTKIIILVAIVALILAIVAIVKLNGNKTKDSKASTLGEVNSAEDLVKLVEKIYEGKDEILPSVQTNVIDLEDNVTVQYLTGLENGNDLEYLVVSEPMMSSQAYSFILAKAKNGANANEIAKTMSEKIDPRKWICVSAEKIYATNSGDIICLVMSSEEWAKPVYDTFKKLAGTVGKEYEKTETEAELPPELY